MIGLRVAFLVVVGLVAVTYAGEGPRCVDQQVGCCCCCGCCCCGCGCGGGGGGGGGCMWNQQVSRHKGQIGILSPHHCTMGQNQVILTRQKFTFPRARE